jgi:hypothetical protein
MNIRKRDLAPHVARLVVERDEKLERLLEIEKILGFTQ